MSIFSYFVTPEKEEERKEICKNCPERNPLINICRACGCFIPAKAKIIATACPLGKW